jgi:peptidoglycan/LPS O-acetylase OafA/YrhL
LRSQNIAYQERIDHLRLFAASLVLFYHALGTSLSSHHLSALTVANSPVLRFLLQGHTAVGLFMTLTGFLFAIICKDKTINLWSFYRNRILRIYPLFIAVLLLAIYINPMKNGFLSLLISLCLMHATAGSVCYPILTNILWTIPVESQFYMLFPLLLGFYRKIGAKYIVGLICLAIATRAAVYLLNGTVHNLAYLSIFGRIDQFLIGMLFGLNYKRLQTRLANPLWFVGACLTVLAALFLFEKSSAGEDTSNSPLWIVWTTIEGSAWGLIIASYLAARLVIPPRLSSFLADLGTLSFSVYVIHFVICLLTFNWYSPLVYNPHHRYPFLIQLATYLQGHEIVSAFVYSGMLVLPVTLAVSFATYNLIEKPFLLLRSRYVVDPHSSNVLKHDQIVEAR